MYTECLTGDAARSYYDACKAAAKRDTKLLYHLVCDLRNDHDHIVSDIRVKIKTHKPPGEQDVRILHRGQLSAHQCDTVGGN